MLCYNGLVMNVPFFSHHALRTAIAKNTTAQVLGKIFSSASVFLVSIAIARLFGSNGYGEFTKITTYVPLFYLFSDFGLNAIYLQESAKENSRITWQVLLATRILGGIVLSLAALVILQVFPTGTSQGYTPLVKLGIILNIPSILLQSLITTGNVLFQKNLRYDLSAIAVAAGALVLFGYVFLAPFLSTSVNGGILVGVLFFVFSAFTITLLTLYFARQFTGSLSPSFDMYAMKSLFFKALPLGLTLVANLVYFRIDNIILTLTRTTEEVGFYGLAYKFFEFPLVLPVFFMNVLYPILLSSMEDKTHTKRTGEILLKSAFVLFIAGTGTTVMFWVGAPYLALIREEFASATPYLRILSLGLPFFFLSNLTMWTLITYKKIVALWLLYTSAMVSTVFVSVVIIPIYGAMGASVITVISEAALLVISSIYLIQLVTYENRKL